MSCRRYATFVDEAMLWMVGLVLSFFIVPASEKLCRGR